MLCRLSYTGLIYYVVSTGVEPATRLRGLPPQGSGYAILPTRPSAGVAYYDQTWILLPSCSRRFATRHDSLRKLASSVSELGKGSSRHPPWSYGESNPGPLLCHRSALPSAL